VFHAGGEMPEHLPAEVRRMIEESGHEMRFGGAAPGGMIVVHDGEHGEEADSQHGDRRRTVKKMMILGDHPRGDESSEMKFEFDIVDDIPDGLPVEIHRRIEKRISEHEGGDREIEIHVEVDGDSTAGLPAGIRDLIRRQLAGHEDGAGEIEIHVEMDGELPDDLPVEIRGLIKDLEVFKDDVSAKKKAGNKKKDKDPKASSEAADPTAETILTWNGKVVL